MSGPDVIEERVRLIVAEVLDLDPAGLGTDQLLAADLGMDSLAATELALVVEDEFGIRVPQAEREEIRTVGDVIKMVRERVPGASR